MRRARTLLAVALLLAAGAPARAAEPAVRPGRPGDSHVHEVKPGETLSQIAQNTLGDPTLWPALYHANRDQIKDPTRVYPGQRLAIPVIDAERRETLRREADALQGP